jgi:hypothetical protein
VKFEAAKFRIELQLHARFLRQHGINHTSDFAKLASILPSRHINFASLDETKLRKQLLRSGLSRKRRDEIAKGVAARKNSLWSTLRYLRRNAKLTNVRRLLTPLVSINALIGNSLEDWARQWPSGPNRLNPGTNEMQTVEPSMNAVVRKYISTHGENV